MKSPKPADLARLNFGTFSVSVRLAVLASGNGSNLQRILDCSSRGELAAQVSAVFSDVPHAFALTRATDAAVPAVAIEPRDYADSVAYDLELCRRIRQFEPDLVVLAGYMRIMTEQFVKLWPQRIMNIHPSLLPKHKGLNTHQRVLDAGDMTHGATVHFVTPELDAGPIIVQAETKVDAQDTVADLQLKVHRLEHRIYPLAIQWYAHRRLSVVDGRVLLDGRVSDEQYLTL